MDSYTVRVPEGRLRFYRLVRSDALVTSFTSNASLGQTRRVGFEDAAEFSGISVYSAPDLAREKAQRINRALVRNGERPWTHLAEFIVDGALGHAIANMEPPEGHFTVWGEPEVFASSVLTLDPI